jgi:GntR family transcriptional regulator
VLPDERVALHARLRQAIQDHVTSGSWRPGDQIPTIRQLGELYGVSHITVVKALDSLSRDGLLVRRQGKGIFVVQPTPDAPQVPLRSFTEETIGRGQTPSSRTLILRREPADPRLSARLGLRKGDDVVLLRRLRLIDGSPVAIQQVYLPAQFVPGLIERTEPIESLYQLLADTYDNVPANALESYTPTHLSPDQARSKPDPAHSRSDRCEPPAISVAERSSSRLPGFAPTSMRFGWSCRVAPPEPTLA